MKYSKRVQKTCQSVFLSDIDDVMCVTQNSLRGEGEGWSLLFILFNWMLSLQDNKCLDGN